MEDSSAMKVVSLFCGAGGMDLGFKQAGFDIIWANDIYKYACETYKKNFGIDVIHRDIRKIKVFPKADVLVACNPCQGFSMIGKRDEKDERNTLYRQIFRALRKIRPKYFVVENVSGLRHLYEGKFFKRMLCGFYNIGYWPAWQVVNAMDYGAPQSRERIIIVGVRKDLKVRYKFPPKTHGPGLKPYVTLRDSIGHLPAPQKGEYYSNQDWHFFYMSRNRRADWDSVSFTIQTEGRNIPLHPSSPPMVKVGKDHWKFVGDASKYRRLSIRECARIQTFPDDFEFAGELGSQYKLIGNAVPPLLARRIAESIKSLEEKRHQAKVNGAKLAAAESKRQEICAQPIALVQK